MVTIEKIRQSTYIVYSNIKENPKSSKDKIKDITYAAANFGKR